MHGVFGGAKASTALFNRFPQHRPAVGTGAERSQLKHASAAGAVPVERRGKAQTGWQKTGKPEGPIHDRVASLSITPMARDSTWSPEPTMDARQRQGARVWVCGTGGPARGPRHWTWRFGRPRSCPFGGLCAAPATWACRWQAPKAEAAKAKNLQTNSPSVAGHDPVTLGASWGRLVQRTGPIRWP